MIVFICIWFNYFKKKYRFSPVRGSNFSSYFFNDETFHVVLKEKHFSRRSLQNWKAEKTTGDYYKLQLKLNSVIVQILSLLL